MLLSILYMYVLSKTLKTYTCMLKIPTFDLCQNIDFVTSPKYVCIAFQECLMRDLFVTLHKNIIFVYEFISILIVFFFRRSPLLQHQT